VQRMRARAADAGTLQSTPQQTVVNEEKIIRIEPAQPQVIYVPTYAPAVYGPAYVAPAPAPYYPSFWTTPGGVVTAGVIGFGAGLATAALFTSVFDWHHHDVYCYPHGWGHGHGNVYVTNNYYQNARPWNFQPQHRRGVPYRTVSEAKRYGGHVRGPGPEGWQR